MKGSCHFELACLKKENILASFWFDTSAMLFRATRGLVGHDENTGRWILRHYEGLL